MSEFALSDLASLIATRARDGDLAASHTARLLAGGVARCAKKFGEEAVEAALAAVMTQLERRTAKSGLEEKAARQSKPR
jgi:phosphoribosyl-ATP pyrophosphohydrolase